MKYKILSVILLLLLTMCTGCSKQTEPTKVILTMGFAEDEVFRIETESCSKAEIMLLLTNTQNQYEAIYGPEIWEMEFDGILLEDGSLLTGKKFASLVSGRNALWFGAVTVARGKRV